YFEAPRLVRPGEELSELGEQFRFGGGDHAEQHGAGRAVDRQQLTFAHAHAVDREAARLFVYGDRFAATDAWLAEAARDECCVAAHATAFGEDALRRLHPVDVVRRRLFAHEDDSFVRFTDALRRGGV